MSLQFAANDGGPGADVALAAIFGSRLFLGPATPVTRAFWRSVILDCRNDLESSLGSQPTGAPLKIVPESGIDLDLWLQFFTTNLFGTTAAGNPPANLRVQAVEFGNPIDPGWVFPFQAPVDITAQVMAGSRGAAAAAPPVPGSAIVRFNNPGPMRYWQVAVSVDITAADFAILQSTVDVAGAAY